MLAMTTSGLAGTVRPPPHIRVIVIGLRIARGVLRITGADDDAVLDGERKDERPVLAGRRADGFPVAQQELHRFEVGCALRARVHGDQAERDDG